MAVIQNKILIKPIWRTLLKLNALGQNMFKCICYYSKHFQNQMYWSNAIEDFYPAHGISCKTIAKLFVDWTILTFRRRQSHKSLSQDKYKTDLFFTKKLKDKAIFLKIMFVQCKQFQVHVVFIKAVINNFKINQQMSSRSVEVNIKWFFSAIRVCLLVFLKENIGVTNI